MMNSKILVVDDDDKILFAFRQVLQKEGYSSVVAKNGEEAIAKVLSDLPDMVFMDITMPKLDGLDALRQIKKRNPLIPVVIITGFGTMQTAIRAMQLGAFEYLTKPLDVEKIREVSRRALLSVKSAREAQPQQLPLDTVGRYELVGNSTRMQEVFKLIGSISTTPNHTSVMILGESGTGKELVARSIHAHSSNAHDPFVAINCTALPETLLESELFGHEKGAFTGASERKMGKFEAAGNGSIFLDEIGNLSLDLQQKLLRVLQEREFERLGGNQPIHVKARFIAATNKDIDAEVENGKFREDLFYRLNVVKVALPPLRERVDDIPLLANHFLLKYTQQFSKSVKALSQDALALLQSYTYPGNVRELENLIEHTVMLTKGEVVLAETLSKVLTGDPAKVDRLPVVSPVFSKAKEHIVALFEKQFLIEQLAKHSGNVTAAARSSQMTRQNFQRLMKKYAIQAEAFRK